ncbi:hypothetical protein B0H13DRAFT_2304642 [Mycena leptocephala]|nr:hypothetical protein B0H13DRAFT_2304642 [Mycena leptocephala]
MSFHELGIPTSEATVLLKVFDVVSSPRAVSVPTAGVMQPVPAGHEVFHVPVFAFLDIENTAPPIAAAVKASHLVMPVDRDIVEQLVDHGVDLDSINAVIWSHAHFDHIGDMSKFPASTELVFGASTVTATYAVDPKSALTETDLAGRKLVPLKFEESPLEIGGFKAHDYFGDGSFYLLDVPGVPPRGHVCALARVTPSSFVFLGADACHHAGMFRPTAKLHRHVPCPGELLAATRRSVSATHFPPPDTAGHFDLAARKAPMLDVAENGYYDEPPAARASIAKMGPFPTSLNAWQAKGWKRDLTWAFLDEANPAFMFNAKATP